MEDQMAYGNFLIGNLDPQGLEKADLNRHQLTEGHMHLAAWTAPSAFN
jgi:hypothetical protein